VKAIAAFELTYQRALDLIAIHRKLHSRGKPPRKSADILRAAVVFAVSGMDAYFTDKIRENAVPLIKMLHGQDLPESLVNVISDQLNTGQMLRVMLQKRPLAHIGSAVRRALAQRTYQDPGKIEKGLKIIKVSNFWCEVARELGTTQKRLKSDVAAVVLRRHKIVHQGDLGRAKKTRHRLTQLGRSEAEKMVKTIGKFVQAANKVIDKQLRMAYGKGTAK